MENTPKGSKKLLSYAGQVLLVFGSSLAAIWLYDFLNKPKPLPPASAAESAKPA